jgi:hypothetical protein
VTETAGVEPGPAAPVPASASGDRRENDLMAEVTHTEFERVFRENYGRALAVGTHKVR